MTLRPRYRPGVARRPFVDREAVLAAFDDAFGSRGSGVRVFNLTGVGGIGKSRLLDEVGHRLPAGTPTAVVDFQVPAQREQLSALAVLRARFGEQGVKFHRFDIAYAVLWQRLHPRLSLAKEGGALIQGSEVLTDLLDNFAVVPVVGLAAKLAEAAGRGVAKWHHIRHDETLQELDGLSLPQLMDAVTYLFAEDLRRHAERLPAGADRPVVLCDAYEALIGGVSRAGRIAALDSWLRDLVYQLDFAFVVIASREAAGWERDDDAWADITRTVPVEELPMDARLELLRTLGVDDPVLGVQIAAGSAGLPFYLHLAFDAGVPTGGAITPSALLERFLAHVDPSDVRILELLSAARLFDREIFRAVAAAHGLPSFNDAWEQVTRYSFVQPAADAGYRLHQLMSAAMYRRLSWDHQYELHRLLHRVWRDRADAAADPALVAASLREAAFHGVWGEDLDPVDYIGYADRVRAAAATSVVKGMIADLDEHLAVYPSDATAQLALCLRAETMMHGDAAGAIALTASVPVEPPVDEIGARLAVAAANARRIGGETADALRRYEVIRDGYAGEARFDAGLWAADLHMVQGRFTAAIEAAGEVEAQLAADRHTDRGDLRRLIHLAYRFAYDFDMSREYLRLAAESYGLAGSIVGLADIQVNTAELLALYDPVAAIAAAGSAIEKQLPIGTEHELGKAYSAMGLAHTRLGEMDAAWRALDEACACFDRAGYRSGRARAELYRAGWHARAGDPDAALVAIRWAIAQFELLEVYPTMVIVSVRLAERLGRPDPALAASAARAAASLSLPPGVPDLDARIGAILEGLLDDGLSARYEAALASGSRAAGFYNHNVRVGDDLVRIPIPASDTMDLTIWDEPLVMAAVNRYLPDAPRLRAVSASPAFQIHEYVEGDLVDAIAPRGTAVPDGLVAHVAAFFGRLAAVAADDLPPVPEGWPADGDTAAFAARLSAVTAGVHRVNLAEFGDLWQRLGFPGDALAPIDWSTMTARPFRLVHADVHRKNMIRRTGGGYAILDWELALHGDPVYDLASHLHKMGYLAAEEQLMLAEWPARQDPAKVTGWRADLDTYLRHERLKSALVDSVRYRKLLVDPATPPDRAAEMVDVLTAKVRAAHAIWGTGREPDRDEVERALRS